MAKRGNVKGASILRTSEAFQSFVNRGLISRDALEVQLSPAAMRLFEQKVEPSLWYSLEAVDEISRLLVDFEGDGDPRYMRDMGIAAFRSMLERGSIRDFIDVAMRREGNEGATLVQLVGLIYDFGCWTFEGGDLREFAVIFEEAEMMPDLGTQTICGFMEELVTHFSGHRVRVDVERPTRARVIFRAQPDDRLN